MASISRLNTYKEQSSFYDAVAEKDANYVGKQIHAARKDLKISLEQFSQLLMQYGVEITRTALNKWELGKAVPSAYQLLAVCAALHLEDGFDYFVSNTKRPLLNAEGRRKVKEYREDLIASGKYREVPPMLEIRYRDMPVSDLPVSAGTGAFLDEGIFEMVADKLMIKRLNAVLETLTPADQEMIHAVFFDGLSMREYAKRLGVYPRAVVYRMERLLKALRKML